MAKIARALTCERALRAAREEGEDVEWADAPLQTLALVLDDSELGP
ncbi:MAG: hypothetical protein ABI611_02035 [Solirubrobacteraceae bacterium]